MFQAMQRVFDRNTEIISSNTLSTDKGRKLITKIVNALTATSDIGGPMVLMYLLKHPDHYTSHRFRMCFWKGYIYEVMKAWPDSSAIGVEGDSKVMLGKRTDDTQAQEVVALSPILDYIWRPQKYTDHSIHEDILVGGGHRYEEEESDDELLLTHESNVKLVEEVDCEMAKPLRKRTKFDMFYPSHPQHLTHHIMKLNKTDAYISNFVGAPMPCRDKGSQEEYCMTM
ncbi:hypothetical protein C8Q80DRAFT_1079729, partial [Daedaleopsis nitida]